MRRLTIVVVSIGLGFSCTHPLMRQRPAPTTTTTRSTTTCYAAVRVSADGQPVATCVPPGRVLFGLPKPTAEVIK